MSSELTAISQQLSARSTARPRRSIDLETEGVVRRLPIRWRLLAIAAMNVTVAVILAALIWNGANVLSRAWTMSARSGIRQAFGLARKRSEPAAEP